VITRFSVTGWFVIAGALFVTMSVLAPRLKHLPLSAPVIYLGVGLLLGPTMLGFFSIDPFEHSAVLEVITEIAMLISLFAAGTKMPLPFSWARWRTPILLASLGMVVTIGAVAAFGVLALGLSPGAALLLGAILAPTDPVLATDVQSRHPGDRNHLRFTLTCEAGINDGAAWPFAALGLGLLGIGDLGAHGQRWLTIDLVYGTVAGLAIGVAVGWSLGRLVTWSRRRHDGATVFEDFLGLGLIAVAYGTALLAHATGFLAVFAAGAALRRTELAGVDGPARQAAQGEPDLVSDASLAFEERLARVAEIVLVLMLGGLLYRDAWSWHGAALALFVFVVARPLGAALCVSVGTMPLRARVLIGWFGLRGIGSLYYLMYALQRGIGDELGAELLRLVLTVVALSIWCTASRRRRSWNVTQGRAAIDPRVPARRTRRAASLEMRTSARPPAAARRRRERRLDAARRRWLRHAVVDFAAPRAALGAALLDVLLELRHRAAHARAQDAERVADVFGRALRIVGHGKPHARAVAVERLEPHGAGVRRVAGNAAP
jgi:NhaP-type Na+/H+ or K+/H+ antiporter